MLKKMILLELSVDVRDNDVEAFFNSAAIAETTNTMAGLFCFGADE